MAKLIKNNNDNASVAKFNSADVTEISVQDLLNATNSEGNKIFKQSNANDLSHFEIVGNVLSDEYINVKQVSDPLVGVLMADSRGRSEEK